MAYTDPEPDNEKPLGLGGWAIIAALLAMLAGAVAYAVHAWNAMPGTGISPLGWLFLSLGIVVTTAVGGGLMWLVFYSARKHYDDI
jgi:hypothetical protein